MTSPGSIPTNPAAILAARVFTAMGSGDLADFEVLIHPDAVNRAAVEQPLACRGRGPQAWYATAQWLRNFSCDLQWNVHEAVAEGDLAVLNCTMSGHHTGEHVHYDASGAPAQVMPASGRPFASKQSHWFRLLDGKVVEHWANRDDLGMAMQLGWLSPPTLPPTAR